MAAPALRLPEEPPPTFPLPASHALPQSSDAEREVEACDPRALGPRMPISMTPLPLTGAGIEWRPGGCCPYSGPWEHWEEGLGPSFCQGLGSERLPWEQGECSRGLLRTWKVSIVGEGKASQLLCGWWAHSRTWTPGLP